MKVRSRLSHRSLPDTEPKQDNNEKFKKVVGIAQWLLVPGDCGLITDMYRSLDRNSGSFTLAN